MNSLTQHLAYSEITVSSSESRASGLTGIITLFYNKTKDKKQEKSKQGHNVWLTHESKKTNKQTKI